VGLAKKIINKLVQYDEEELNLSRREQWLEAALQTVPAGSRILDAGAGQLKYKMFCGHLNYVAQDFGNYSGEGDGKGIQTGKWDQTKLDIVSDITAIPEPDASFDAIMCIEVFEHLPDPLAALTEFQRLLKPGGILILTAPFCAFTHFSPYFFGTGFSPYWYQKHLVDKGFSILELQPNGNFPAYLIQEVTRIRAIAARYAKMKPSLWEYLGLRLTLSFLKRIYAKDKESQEFVCFGYHVRAVKKTDQAK
jgi:ubiquinone/menaquinone biosynthesis C-methylase UbiE